MPHVERNGVRIFYREWPARGRSAHERGKPTIVFSHGYLLDHSMFEDVATLLSEEYRCVGFDHRAHGASDAPASGYALDDLCDDAIAVIRAAADGPVHFVGLSTGGYVGMRLALRVPELLRSVTLMDTSSDAEPERARRKYKVMLAVFRAIGIRLLEGRVLRLMFSPAFLASPANAKTVDHWRRVFRASSRRVADFGEGIFGRDSVTNQLGRITTPTLVIVGEHDIATPLRNARTLHEGIVHSELFVVPGAGHCSSVEAPQVIADRLRGFLAERS